jgi:hypothetical protein
MKSRSLSAPGALATKRMSNFDVHSENICTKPMGDTMRLNLKFAVAIFGSTLLTLGSAYAAPGYSAAATPTRVDTTADGGFMVFGAFGNAASCTANNQYFVKDSHPQSKMIYSMVLLAMTTGQKITFFAHACEPVNFYSGPTVTYNVVTFGGAVLTP